MDGKWICELPNREIWNTCVDEFETKEQAIEYGKKFFVEEGYDVDRFNVGQKHSVSIPCIDAGTIIDIVTERMYDDVGEVSEDWLYSVSKEEKQKLEERMDKVFEDWLTEVKEMPSFFKVTNIETISINDGF